MTDHDAVTEAEFLAGYRLEDYPAVAVTVDVVCLTIIDGQLSVLLVQRAQHPYRGCWALPGGFRNPRETLDAAATRELSEETGISLDVTHIEQLATFGDPGRDPRGDIISVAYLAFAPGLGQPRAGSDARAARFWPIADLTGDDAPTLAFDHPAIIDAGVERARAKLEYTTLATAFVAAPFTISDLRRVYEAVWGVDVHAANFRRKVTTTDGFVVPTGETINLGRGKPAVLFNAGPATWLDAPIMRPEPEDPTR